PAAGDDAPPPAVADLRADSVGSVTATLRWTAPALPHGTGGAAAYEVRSARLPLTEANFPFGVAEPGVPPPAAAGQPERLHLATLVPQRVNYVGLRARDRFGGWSPISNVLALSTARDYWFAVRAEDAAGHRSPISRALRVRTDVGGPLRGTGGVALAFGAQPARGSVSLYWRGGGAAPQSLKLFDLSGRIVKAV